MKNTDKAMAELAIFIVKVIGSVASLVFATGLALFVVSYFRPEVDISLGWLPMTVSLSIMFITGGIRVACGAIPVERRDL